MQTIHGGSSPGATTESTTGDTTRLDQVVESLALVADVCRSDQLVYVEQGGWPVAVHHVAPRPVPSLYPGPQVGQRLDRRALSPVYRVLERPGERQTVNGAFIWGSPTFQEASPIRSGDGRIIGVLSSNGNLHEHERFLRQDPLFRSAVEWVRDQALDGRLQGAEKLGRLTEHDGVMVVDQHGVILFLNSVAEHQYRRVGYVDSLLRAQISHLETNEYICFRSMERGICLEQRVQEQDQAWIKRVIPVFISPAPGKIPRLVRRMGGRPPRRVARETEPNAALVFIQDITEDVRREQELKIKGAMIQEVHHRVKNNLQAVAALLGMEADRTSSEVARATLHHTLGRVMSIAVVHEFLSRGDLGDINMREVCQRILAQVSEANLRSDCSVEFSVDGEAFSLPAQQATSCALAMNELISNAVEHGFDGRPKGFIRISLRQTEASTVIEIADDGVGLPPGFDLSSNPSLGLEITQTLVQGDLHGRLELLDQCGTIARISFPKELCRPVA
jgi:two-component sensor histidine kinase